MRCAFCEFDADYYCPISGADICAQTCNELCIWADEYRPTAGAWAYTEGEVWLEFMAKVVDHSRNVLGLRKKQEVAQKCKECPCHWREISREEWQRILREKTDRPHRNKTGK